MLKDRRTRIEGEREGSLPVVLRGWKVQLCEIRGLELSTVSQLRVSTWRRMVERGSIWGIGAPQAWL